MQWTKHLVQACEFKLKSITNKISLSKHIEPITKYVHHKFGADLRFEDKFINQSNVHIEKSSTNTKIDATYYLATTKNII